MKAWKRITTFKANISSYCSLFDDGGPYIENSPLICSANQRTGFCVVGTSVMKELNVRKFKILMFSS